MVRGIVLNYYHNLFTSTHNAIQDELLEAIEARVLKPMNALLIKEFEAGEVRKAVKQMCPLKALGPNSMNPLFY